MDFALTANQESIGDAVAKICTRFDDAYWLKIGRASCRERVFGYV